MSSLQSMQPQVNIEVFDENRRNNSSQKADWVCLQFSFQDYNCKLSDFGLAEDGPEGEETHVTTRVMGTKGYAAPEYIMTGKLN